MYPHDSAYMTEVYTDATKPAFGYLYIDLKQETQENLRLRTLVLESEQYIYVPKV